MSRCHTVTHSQLLQQICGVSADCSVPTSTMNGFPGSSFSDFQVTLWQSDPAPKILGVWDHLEKCTIKHMTEGSSTFSTMVLFSLHSDQARFCCRGSQPQWVAWMLAQLCWTWEICHQQSQGQSRFSQVLSDWLISQEWIPVRPLYHWSRIEVHSQGLQ